MRKGITHTILAVLLLSVAGLVAFTTGYRHLHLHLRRKGTMQPEKIQLKDWTLEPATASFYQIGQFMTSHFSQSLSNHVKPFLILSETTQNSLETMGMLTRFIQKQNPAISREIAAREAAAFLRYSTKYGAPLDLVVAVANTESHFNPLARSTYGAAGVMQVMWKIHSNLLRANGIRGEEELFAPEQGIAAGCLLISRYLRAYGSPEKALGRYYGGPSSVYWARVSRNLSKLQSYNPESRL
ncbi:transglycosylase SLT domain-containing protein [Aminobacterium mobile]